MDEPKRGRGRPKGSKDNKTTIKKIRLKPTPKTAKEIFKKEYRDLELIAVYGVDEFTEELIRYLWTDMSKTFFVTDPVEQRAANLTRSIGSLPYSLHRYKALPPQGWIEEGIFPVIIVAERCWEAVNKLPNPEKVELVCLSHWDNK